MKKQFIKKYAHYAVMALIIAITIMITSFAHASTPSVLPNVSVSVHSNPSDFNNVSTDQQGYKFTFKTFELVNNNKEFVTIPAGYQPYFIGQATRFYFLLENHLGGTISNSSCVSQKTLFSPSYNPVHFCKITPIEQWSGYNPNHKYRFKLAMGYGANYRKYAFYFSNTNQQLSSMQDMHSFLDKFNSNTKPVVLNSVFPKIPSKIIFKNPISSPVPIPYTFSGTYTNDKGYTKMVFHFYNKASNLYIKREHALPPVSGSALPFSFNLKNPPAGSNYWYADLRNADSSLSSVPLTPIKEKMGQISFDISTDPNNPSQEELELMLKEKYDCDPSAIDVSTWNLKSQAKWVVCSIKHFLFKYIAGVDTHAFKTNFSNNLQRMKDEVVPFAYIKQIRDKIKNAIISPDFIIGIDIPAMGNIQAQNIVFIDLANIQYTPQMTAVIDVTEKYLRMFLHMIITIGLFALIAGKGFKI